MPPFKLYQKVAIKNFWVNGYVREFVQGTYIGECFNGPEKGKHIVVFNTVKIHLPLEKLQDWDEFWAEKKASNIDK